MSHSLKTNDLEAVNFNTRFICLNITELTYDQARTELASSNSFSVHS